MIFFFQISRWIAYKLVSHQATKKKKLSREKEKRDYLQKKGEIVIR
jgi:hypothetical protein